MFIWRGWTNLYAVSAPDKAPTAIIQFVCSNLASSCRIFRLHSASTGLAVPVYLPHPPASTLSSLVLVLSRRPSLVSSTQMAPRELLLKAVIVKLFRTGRKESRTMVLPTGISPLKPNCQHARALNVIASGSRQGSYRSQAQLRVR